MPALNMSRREIVQMLLERDDNLCKHPDCKLPFTEKDGPTIDHWIPQSKGGSSELVNLKLMHKRCNSQKSDRVPDADGNLPALKKRETITRAMRRDQRPVVCTACKSGRLLGPDEECMKCGSGPMPPKFPGWSKMRPSECTHEGIWWCWCCICGIVERTPASKYVFDDGEPGID